MKIWSVVQNVIYSGIGSIIVFHYLLMPSLCLQTFILLFGGGFTSWWLNSFLSAILFFKVIAIIQISVQLTLDPDPISLLYRVPWWTVHFSTEELLMKGGSSKERTLNIPYHEVQIGKSLDRGAFGEVYHGFWRDNEVAVKVSVHNIWRLMAARH